MDRYTYPIAFLVLKMPLTLERTDREYLTIESMRFDTLIVGIQPSILFKIQRPLLLNIRANFHNVLHKITSTCIHCLQAKLTVIKPITKGVKKHSPIKSLAGAAIKPPLKRKPLARRFAYAGTLPQADACAARR